MPYAVRSLASLLPLLSALLLAVGACSLGPEDDAARHADEPPRADADARLGLGGTLDVDRRGYQRSDVHFTLPALGPQEAFAAAVLRDDGGLLARLRQRGDAGRALELDLPPTAASDVALRCYLHDALQVELALELVPGVTERLGEIGDDPTSIHVVEKDGKRYVFYDYDGQAGGQTIWIIDGDAFACSHVVLVQDDDGVPAATIRLSGAGVSALTIVDEVHYADEGGNLLPAGWDD